MSVGLALGVIHDYHCGLRDFLYLLLKASSISKLVKLFHSSRQYLPHIIDAYSHIAAPRIVNMEVNINFIFCFTPLSCLSGLLKDSPLTLFILSHIQSHI